MSAAEENEVVDGRRSAVGAGSHVVHVAEGGRPAAALGDAAAVSGGDGSALPGGDLVGHAGQTDDLASVIEDDPIDLCIATQRLDERPRRRTGPRSAGAFLTRVLLDVDEEAG
jgi:hypothetical protein